MIFKAYGAAFKAIGKAPFKLLGLSALGTLMCSLSIAFSTPIYAVGAILAFIFSLGLCKLYADAARGIDVNSDQLFGGFKRFWNAVGGLFWISLWRAIWCLVVVAGFVLVFVIFYAIGYLFSFSKIISEIIVILGGVNASIVAIALMLFATYKIYQYSFFPFILAEKEDVSFTQALRLSIEMTKGKVIKMFLADLLSTAAISVTLGILFLLCLIPYAGAIFIIATLAFLIVVCFFYPIFHGIYTAYFYISPECESKFENGINASMSRVTAKAGEIKVEKAEAEAPAEAAPEAEATETPNE